MKAFFGFNCKPKNKDAHIKSEMHISPDDYMQNRVVYKLKLYMKLANKQKIYYLSLSLIGIFLSAIVTVLINFSSSKFWPTALSMLVTVTVSVEKLFRFREHWANYDQIAAFLRSEQLKYQTKTGEYSDKKVDANQAYATFVAKIERAIFNERMETIDMRTSNSME